MAGITPPSDQWALRLLDRFDRIEQQVRSLQQPTGTQIGSLVNQVQQALIGIAATVATNVNSYLAGGFSTGGNVSVTGNVSATGTVAAGGSVSGSSGTFSGGLSSPGASATDLSTIAGLRQNVWQLYTGANVGVYGYAPSSIETKANLAAPSFTAEQFLACSPFVYEYRGQIAIRDDPDNESYDPTYVVPTEIGFMAEHLIEHGLSAFVTMREGTPIGIDYPAFASVGAVIIGQAQQATIQKLLARVEALEGHR